MARYTSDDQMVAAFLNNSTHPRKKLPHTSVLQNDRFLTLISIRAQIQRDTVRETQYLAN